MYMHIAVDGGKHSVHPLPMNRICHKREGVIFIWPVAYISRVSGIFAFSFSNFLAH